ncbi:NAD(P)/FAD-dependent oxidoreductase [Lysobacter sp. BMK333-48F3]|uniref:NAD(P)/FAD-dependent oxidoreductase n=1 Tax=Lysobacter sp. BMK333-48F3 TaxID=2867962 RepID=UPI001C8C22FA|nr:NAD(P)/FAD-dependent oxidoreductase [Lysobacter sp. BMK333-48F3]MBX9400309.1 NAD(P)/FAD-dependent oxidoreductase [Lysobacter sp. BMK333-48F3]
MGIEGSDYEVVVVGGSFAGLSAALMLARARKRVLVIDAGRPRNRFAAHSHGVLGHDGKAPQDLLAEALTQLMAYPSVSLKQAIATTAERTATGFALRLDSGERVSARKLVLATGVRDVAPDLPGLRERWGRSVLHCPYCHGFEYAGRPLGVLATGDVSLHQAMLIPEWGPTTYFTQQLTDPDAETCRQLQALGVRIEPVPVLALRGEGQALAEAVLADGRALPVEAMFVAPRIEPVGDLAQQLGCEFADGLLGPYLKVDELKRTSVPGVFAAGDLAAPMHSAALALAAGAMAGLSAHRSLLEERPGLLAA